MPIAVYATEGLLSSAAEKKAFKELTAALLKQLDLVGNTFLTPNVIGEIHIIPKGQTFSGGEPNDIVVVELKIPSFALATLDQKQGFISEATDIFVTAAGGKLPKERIFVNMVYTVDGFWGIAGKAYTNAQLGEAVQMAAAA